MIEFTDATLRESRGYYDDTKKLMEEDGPLAEWMLRSTAFVSTQFSATAFVLHFWKNGQVAIYDTDRPMLINSSDEDLRELSSWCQKAGWTGLGLNDRLLSERHSYDFWRRQFVAGLIVNDKLEKHENEEMERLSQAYLAEKKEDNDAT